MTYFCVPIVRMKDAIVKPNPGMLLAAAEKHKIDLGKSYMVGDRASLMLWRDREPDANRFLLIDNTLKVAH